MILSVLICSLDRRKAKLTRLLEHLEGQIDACNLRGQAEIITMVDDGCMKIGAKRNCLVAQAQGDYVCFVDDDDAVADDYIRSLVNACRQDTDCVGFRGQVKVCKWRPFVISLRYRTWSECGKEFRRSPNHLVPIRTRIVRRFPFPERNNGEDAEFSSALVRTKALQTETFIDRDMYFYLPSDEYAQRNRTYPRRAKIYTRRK